MKTILMILAMTIATANVNAELKPDGTFIPSRCGNNELKSKGPRATHVRRLCMGRIKGNPAPLIVQLHVKYDDMVFVQNYSTEKIDGEFNSYRLIPFNDQAPELTLKIYHYSLGGAEPHAVIVDETYGFEGALEAIYTTMSL